ncbi:pentatricopeptide repeat (PPR) superfamily protein [Striga asiatica]|uniref:Pentatricopeptide repeat (PPR) superfamily protein n=1 Tax=Striga asiatica TaxID=4170 RepID=A0A5A7Q117_STRAF|nr:pentatricopeptide repeat (PPR) superfamily protein [Striga asiatica]
MQKKQTIEAQNNPKPNAETKEAKSKGNEAVIAIGERIKQLTRQSKKREWAAPPWIQRHKTDETAERRVWGNEAEMVFRKMNESGGFSVHYHTLLFSLEFLERWGSWRNFPRFLPRWRSDGNFSNIMSYNALLEVYVVPVEVGYFKNVKPNMETYEWQGFWFEEAVKAYVDLEKVVDESGAQFMGN